MSKNSTKKLVVDEGQKRKQQLIQMKKADPSSLKETIYTLREQLSTLNQDKLQIERKIEQHAKQYMNDTYRIESITKGQEEEIIQRENQLKRLRLNHNQIKTQLKYRWKEELQQLEKKKKKQKQTIQNNQKRLTEKIDHLKQFAIREKEYIKKIEILKKKQQQNQAAQKQDIQNIKRQNEHVRTQLSEATNKKIKSIKDSEVKKLQSCLVREQLLKRENQLMIEKITLCEVEKKILQEECSKLGEKRQEGGTGEQLNGEATMTYQRSLRVIKLQNKLAKLKQKMQSQITTLQQEYVKINNKADEQQNMLLDQIKKAEGWLKIKEKDLKKMKDCAQMVLNERNNLQYYLLQVFYQHPDIDYKNPQNTSQIMRLLFIKINSKKPPMTYKSYQKTQPSELSNSSHTEK